MLALLLFMVPSRRQRLLPGHWRPGPRDLVSAGTTAAAGAGFREAAPAPPASSPDSGVGAAPPRLGYRRLPQPAPVQVRCPGLAPKGGQGAETRERGGAGAVYTGGGGAAMPAGEAARAEEEPGPSI